MASNAGGDEQEVADDDLGVSFYKDETLDLGEVMREQFYLALPMKPLCQPDCQGLCPVCGINRNRETCTCQAEWIGSALDALKRLTEQPIADSGRRFPMPNPKRRHSKTRTAKRRTHDALKPIGTSECPQCHELKLPHIVCKNCGYYRGAGQGSPRNSPTVRVEAK